MRITITPEDIWNEFVFYRKAGLHETAFKHIRHKGVRHEWGCILAGVAHHNYNVQIGDIITMDDIEVVWTEMFEDAYGPVIQNSQPNILQDSNPQETLRYVDGTTP